ncbi:hypothetical protein K503DRAFT_770794 [Rhizopogon vinicolor AM-OR11-026]|uniref:Uncharacterized protein n=1 Tax=Rhizopogon vinicolor AM-OR11-026 TaxID=1314800 RepID=A0A1B7MZV6_9AGAM|nr:hypothetical protein K503DRAFT_770794 [Rhizopogon vinicolor AM-OR11-026]
MDHFPVNTFVSSNTTPLPLFHSFMQTTHDLAPVSLVMFVESTTLLSAYYSFVLVRP